MSVDTSNNPNLGLTVSAGVCVGSCAGDGTSSGLTGHVVLSVSARGRPETSRLTCAVAGKRGNRPFCKYRYYRRWRWRHRLECWIRLHNGRRWYCADGTGLAPKLPLRLLTSHQSGSGGLSATANNAIDLSLASVLSTGTILEQDQSGSVESSQEPLMPSPLLALSPLVPSLRMV
jgi:hypothetical protein